MSEEVIEYGEAKHEDEMQRIFRWFNTDREAKSTIEEEFQECHKIYANKHWELKDPLGMPIRSRSQMQNRPNMVENFTMSLIEGMVSEFTEDLDIVDYPNEEGDDAIANVMTNMKKFVLYKNRISKKRESFARNYFLLGTGIWHTVWDPTWKGGRGPNRWHGEIRVESLHPQVVFPDARCRLDIEDGQRIHKGFYKTVEFVKEKYGVDVPADTTSLLNLLGEDDYLDVSGEDEECLIVETWYKGKPIFPTDKDDPNEGYGMHVVRWAGETSPVYLNHENYVYYDAEEDCKFPFHFATRYPRENSVWGYGEAYYLKPIQIALNKTAELILEGHMHFAMGQTFYRQGAITPKQEKFLRQYGTMPNMYFAVNNIDDIKRVHGSGVAPSLPGEMGRLMRSMEGVIGRHDVSQGRTPGSVVAFRALDLLAARARIRLRSAETAILTSYEDVGNYMNHLITRFYTETRAYRILGKNAEKTEYVLIHEETGNEHPFLGQIPPGYELITRTLPLVEHGVFRPDDIKKVYVYDDITGFEDVLPYNDEVAQAIDLVDMMKEDESFTTEIGTEYEIYSPELDTQCKISTVMTSDRAFYMDMAKELFMGQIIDEETFWYVMSNGRFPPFEYISNKRKREAASVAEQEAEMAKMEAEQQASMPPEGMPEGMPEGLPEGMPMDMPQGAPMAGMPPSDMPMSIPMQPDMGPPLSPMLEQIFADNPNLWEKFKQLPPEMQEQLANQIMHGRQGM